MNPLIEFKNVSFRYQEDGPWILRDCTFMINQGESVAIIGHNGSGKSTVAKLMNGLLFPQEGEIWINGRQLSEASIWEIRKDVGMVFQNPDNQFVGATVQDDVAFGMENRGMERTLMEKRITTSLEAVNMTAYRLTEPHRLSGGQKQRVAIAGVIAISPKVMILDEATVMLDPKGRVEIMDTMKNLKEQEELSLLTITHHLGEIITLDKVIVLNEGRIWEIGTPQEILQKGQQLQHIGLDMPFIVALKEELTKEGIPITNHPLNIKDLLEELWTLHSTK
jgi:energy-coupling factor transport system ATP-binding protein